MAKAESEKVRSAIANVRADKTQVYRAAVRYVNQGLKDLNLKRDQYTKLQDKLIPIVEKTIGAERGRTSTRGEAIVVRTADKKVKAATKKIIGGK